MKLIRGKCYGIAHNRIAPCVHFRRWITADFYEQELLCKLTDWQASNKNYWFLVVESEEGGWEIVSEKDTSMFELFSED